MPFADAQKAFREHGQALAWDPPDPGGATIGGIVATADSGPLRHRYGGVRDLVVGITVVLSDGTVAKAGGKVIKNVAGYDLAKLFAGSCGTLGLIASDLRAPASRPGADRDRARRRATTRTRCSGRCSRWRASRSRPTRSTSRGRTARAACSCASAATPRPSGRARRRRDGGLESVEVTDDDGALWDAQRARQRSRDGAVLKVSGRPTDLADVLRAAEHGARDGRRARRARSLLAGVRAGRRSRRPRGRGARRRSRRACARCSTAQTASPIRGRPTCPARS